MEIIKIKKIVFLTGTRADYGKLKSLMNRLRADRSFEVHIFVTGMHMLSKYGYTCEEVEKAGFNNIYKFINQNASDSMDHVLAKTISGLSDYLREIKPDMIIIHGDRVEALAGAAVGALNNTLVGHIEGGELSGTIDELIRHSVTKLAHLHFVANEKAKARLIQLGEISNNVYIIGSPEVDIMNSSLLPSIEEVKKYYDFDFVDYTIVMFHPVTTELDDLPRQITILVDYIINSSMNYVVIYPNNDLGTDIIFKQYERLIGLKNIRMYPSMRFEYFLTLLKNTSLVIGNSSAGVREAPYFGVPSINLGSRQHNRVQCNSIFNVKMDEHDISLAVSNARAIPRESHSLFGGGGSDELFYQILTNKEIWNIRAQKSFIDWGSS